MTGEILLIILLEYIPFFQQVLVFSVLCTYIYRRTGSARVGAFTVATLTCWIVTDGSSML